MSNLFKKVACFTDIHFGLKSNSSVHNQDCEDFVDWYIAKANDDCCDCASFADDGCVCECHESNDWEFERCDICKLRADEFIYPDEDAVDGEEPRICIACSNKGFYWGEFGWYI